jgi:hypothetical protein
MRTHMHTRRSKSCGTEDLGGATCWDATSERPPPPLEAFRTAFHPKPDAASGMLSTTTTIPIRPCNRSVGDPSVEPRGGRETRPCGSRPGCSIMLRGHAGPLGPAGRRYVAIFRHSCAMRHRWAPPPALRMQRRPRQTRCAAEVPGLAARRRNGQRVLRHERRSKDSAAP